MTRPRAILGRHGAGRRGPAARAGAGLAAVPLGRPGERGRARAHAAHAAHRGGAVRHRVRHRAGARRSSACRSRVRSSRDENWAAYAERYTSWTERTADAGSCTRCCSSMRPARMRTTPHRGKSSRSADIRDGDARAPRPEQLRVRRWSGDQRTFEPADVDGRARAVPRRARRASRRNAGDARAGERPVAPRRA